MSWLLWIVLQWTLGYMWHLEFWFSQGICPLWSESHFSSVQSLSRVQLFVTPWIASCQAFLSITNSRSLLKLMSIELVMPSSYFILCHPLLLLPQIPPSIGVFSNESALRMRWLSHVQFFVTPWTMQSMEFSRLEFLLQGIFPTQELNPGLPHCRWILYCLSHQRIPYIYVLHGLFHIFNFWPHCTARGILVPQPGIEHVPLPWKCGVWTTGPPE